MAPNIVVQPSLDAIQDVLAKAKTLPNPPNLVPICTSLSSEFLTPSSIYLKVAAQAKSKLSFLFESAATTETIGRFSFIGADPRKVITSGPNSDIGEKDPLPILNAELSQFRVATVPGLVVPPLIGGAIGYIGYDCVKYFEPKTRRDDMEDVLKLPESLFMLFDTIIALDHFFQQLKVFTYLKVPDNLGTLPQAYEQGREVLQHMVSVLQSKDVPLPSQHPIVLGNKSVSNIGKAGYERHVTTLKEHISRGDIIQAVPSQRFARPTSLHPFNLYRHLRTVNPSPYLFYIECDGFQIVGASPEVLVKSESGRIITHPIAGTVKRGKTVQMDEQLAAELRGSLKDRAEHVMLVDLARNDVNRVCDPGSTRVDRLMVVQKFSHVQHLVSEVSGVLRPDKTRFDAFRSIFPAGTVSGAPKVKAMELIAKLEREKRGVYAGAVGYFGYNTVTDGEMEEGAMDTCIALRTMVTKDGIAYLQAGGGIVFDSVENDEYEETINKLKASAASIDTAEAAYWQEQNPGKVSGGQATSASAAEEIPSATAKPAHIDLAAG
ncbi:anthranilate synthase component I [Venturia nashicola]|uniref:anthranilate synthase n=1 Tax=Venturia nashicola TaxID=86259 RepID=A0A4Z1PGV1_9PEZI|nr:anthranilate synthase component I [Venturia nashicola]TLD37063.1 anthranilate synthase component I [Venturia nashicola]